MRSLRTPLDLPLALFLVSALGGIWTSYNPTTSGWKFALLAAAVAIYYLIVLLRTAPPLLNVCVWLFLFANAALALYFATQHDFVSQPGKLEWVTSIGLFLNRIFPRLPFHISQPNIVAGALEIALPLGLALAWQMRREHARSRFVLTLALALLIAFGLLMTSSRGAWLALAVAAAAITSVYLASRVFSRYHIPSRIAIPLGINAALILIVILFLAGGMGALLNWIGAVSVGERSISRADLYAQAWQLIGDYPVTGSGLGVFPMVFSTYVLLIQVPFLTHAHNLFLQVWIEQGLLGFTTFLGLIAGFSLWAWNQRTRLNWLGMGALAAAAVMLLHGFVDVLLYSSRGLPLLFVPMALAIAHVQSEGTKSQSRSLFAPDHSRLAIGVGALLAVGVIALWSWNSLTAVWYANLGSVVQTRAELGQYEWPDTLVEDVRRRTDLSEADAYFQQAVRLDPGNRTANQRLGEIALARGEYDRAHEYLEAAFARDPDSATTRQLLGSAYLAQQRFDDAYALWSGVRDAERILEDGAWVWFDRNGDHQRAGWARALAGRIRTERAGNR